MRTIGRFQLAGGNPVQVFAFNGQLILGIGVGPGIELQLKFAEDELGISSALDQSWLQQLSETLSDFGPLESSIEELGQVAQRAREQLAERLST